MCGHMVDWVIKINNLETIAWETYKNWSLKLLWTLIINDNSPQYLFWKSICISYNHVQQKKSRCASMLQEHMLYMNFRLGF